MEWVMELLAKLIRLILWSQPLQVSTHHHLWHKAPKNFLPVKMISGEWEDRLDCPQVWRRWFNGKWEYKQDEPELENWFDRY